MSTYTLKTITKIQGQLHRLYNVKIFDATIFDYIKWRQRCGFNHNFNLAVNGNEVIGTETYTFDTQEAMDGFLYNILYNDDITQNYNRPWDNINVAAMESKSIGVTSLVTYKIAPDGTQTLGFDINQV